MVSVAGSCGIIEGDYDHDLTKRLRVKLRGGVFRNRPGGGLFSFHPAYDLDDCRLFFLLGYFVNFPFAGLHRPKSR